MTLEEFGCRKKRLTACPACGVPLGNNPRETSDHIASHTPEDFGLTPLQRETVDTDKVLLADGGQDA